MEQTPQIIPAQNFSPEEKAKIAEIANGINFSDQSQLVEFGASAQAKTAQFSDSVLQHVKTQELGGVGDSL
ncbi:MAG: toxic anion resistance protein, partial [Clostridiales bacterium]|nr:toxic anion resistance protein [Clostridiales bacterium]